MWESDGRAIVNSTPQGAIMASKDKGGRSTKTAASKSPKEKRQAKKAKKAGKS